MLDHQIFEASFTWSSYEVIMSIPIFNVYLSLLYMDVEAILHRVETIGPASMTQASILSRDCCCSANLTLCN